MDAPLEINNNDCSCTEETTILECQEIADKPCEYECDGETHSLNCVYYDGEDNECFDIENGEDIPSVINKIITKLKSLICPSPKCTYGTSIIRPAEILTKTICVKIQTNSILNTMDFTYSYYNIDNVNSSYSIAQNPTYISSNTFMSIEWNPIKNIYEMFDGSEKIAYTNKSNLQTSYTLNWTIIPSLICNIKSVKSIKNSCI